MECTDSRPANLQRMGEDGIMVFSETTQHSQGNDMAETSIQWCDYTFNPWSGCTKVSSGCANCYAEVNYSVKMRGVKWGPQGNRIVKAESGWLDPLKWNKQAAKHEEDYERYSIAGFGPSPGDPVRPRVFCASLADVFEDWTGPILDNKGDRLMIYIPNGGFLSTRPYAEEPGANCRWMTMQDIRHRLFRLIHATPNLDWLLLTKRPENIMRFWPPLGNSDLTVPVRDMLIRKNVWLGVSVENQQAADERIPHLLRTPAAVRFLSVEPLLGPVDLKAFFACPHCDACTSTGWYPGEPKPCVCGKMWVIIGGESGPNSRPCNIDWIRSIVEQCKTAGVACFVKQLGSLQVRSDWKIPPSAIRSDMSELQTLQPFRPTDPKGGDMAEWPNDLQVREFPRG